MKALFIYNPVSGHHKINRYLKFINKTFSTQFDEYFVIKSLSEEHFYKSIVENGSKYDILIVGGGDGTMNIALNALQQCTNKPILGVVPLGTINDCIKNIGCKSNIKKAVKNIVKQNIKKIDILKINDKYAFYTFACGAFSDIPYMTPNLSKRIFGRFAYYFAAIPRLFKKIRVSGYVEFDKQIINFVTPFVLLLNGKRMGGFSINKHSSMNDGKAELFLVEPSLFNGLLKYFFRRKSILSFKCNMFHLHLEENLLWTVDGEKCSGKDFVVEIKHNNLLIIQ